MVCNDVNPVKSGRLLNKLPEKSLRPDDADTSASPRKYTYAVTREFRQTSARDGKEEIEFLAHLRH